MVYRSSSNKTLDIKIAHSFKLIVVIYKFYHADLKKKTQTGFKHMSAKTCYNKEQYSLHLAVL